MVASIPSGTAGVLDGGSQVSRFSQIWDLKFEISNSRPGILKVAPGSNRSVPRHRPPSGPASQGNADQHGDPSTATSRETWPTTGSLHLGQASARPPPPGPPPGPPPAPARPIAGPSAGPRATSRSPQIHHVHGPSASSRVPRSGSDQTANVRKSDVATSSQPSARTNRTSFSGIATRRRREHEQTHRRQHGRDHQVDHQERQVDHEADHQRGRQLAEQERRRDHPERELVAI